jgi:hypothetical protein
MQAAASATRGSINDVRRKTPTRQVFLGLAYEMGWRNAALLAQACGITRQAVNRQLLRCSTPHAARLCLADPRLRIEAVNIIPRLSFSNGNKKAG